jgi:hypothetical protein
MVDVPTKLIEGALEKDIGKVKVVSVVEAVMYPPWVQDGNDADPDERSGSFTENRQNWKRRHDAGRRKFQQN